ncbi:MAG: dienelactone hydrolase family protein [bacterium]
MGCIALASDLYFRQGSVNGLSNPEQIYPIVSQFPDQQVMQDLDATVTWALENGLTDSQRIGINGFCCGGSIVWLYASINSELKADVAWYGRLDNQVTQNQPRHPINVADDLKYSVLGLYGGQDHLIPNELF